MTRTRILTIAGIAVLAAVAVLGWIRKPEGTPSQSLMNPGGPAYNNSIAPADSNVPAADVPSYGTRPAVRTITRAERRSTQPSDADRGATSSHSSHRVVTKERPFSHSAAIVGAGAGTGAAIGAVVLIPTESSRNRTSGGAVQGRYERRNR